MPDIAERRKEALATAESFESKGRHYKAAEFFLKVAFLSDDDDAYEAYIRRGQILEGIGFNAVGAYRAAQDCAMASNPPSYGRAMESYYLLANLYSRRGRNDLAGQVLREASEVLFVFEDEFEWSDEKAIKTAHATIGTLGDEYTRLFAAGDEPVQTTNAKRSTPPEDTLTPGEVIVGALPEPGFGLSA